METDFSRVQYCPLIVEFHIEVLRPVVEFRISREGNSGLIVRHDVGDRGSIQMRSGGLKSAVDAL